MLDTAPSFSTLPSTVAGHAANRLGQQTHQHLDGTPQSGPLTNPLTQQMYFNHSFSTTVLNTVGLNKTSINIRIYIGIVRSCYSMTTRWESTYLMTKKEMPHNW